MNACFRLLTVTLIATLAMSAAPPTFAAADAVTSEETVLNLPDDAGRLAGTFTRVQSAETVVIMVFGIGADRSRRQSAGFEE